MTDTAREELIEQADYVQLSGGDFLSAVGMDGKKWADAFIQMWGDKLSDIDHGLMLGWFCNAIMAGHDAATTVLQPRLNAAEGISDAGKYLVALKIHKNLYGKDAGYLREQPEAWEKMRVAIAAYAAALNPEAK